MKTPFRRLGLTAAVTALITATGPAHAFEHDPDNRPWSWPLDPVPSVERGFDPPAVQWGSGHRGIDLNGAPGQAVRAVGDGVVTYAAVLAGRGVVVVSHGRIRSTYEPVTAVVRRGDQVAGGQVIGLLQAVRSHCLPAACLHLGARIGEDYVDPESLLGFAEIRLKPLAGLGPAPPPLLLPL